MAKLRHIALSVPDPEAAAKFFEQAFGMTRAGHAMRGIYMSDGIMNVALLNFGDDSITPNGVNGAVGYLVGQEFDGLRQMFHMMNEARVGVGLAATALGYTGYLQALSYARTRA